LQGVTIWRRISLGRLVGLAPVGKLIGIKDKCSGQAEKASPDPSP
jgi:hypothetical protein